MPKKNRNSDAGRWVVQVYQEHHVAKQDFSTASDASAWASRFARELNIKAGSDLSEFRVNDILDRYAQEESPKRVAHRKQVARFNYFKTRIDEHTGEKKYPIVDVLLKDLTRFDFVRFRDQHMQEVTSGTFRQDWSLFHRAIKIAVNEWGWLHRDPLQGIQLPPPPPHRNRRISDDEIKAISEELLSQSKRSNNSDKPFRMLLVFLLAIETALRKSELLCLRRGEVFLDKSYLKVSGIEPNARKSPAAVRNVPLTSSARRILSIALESNWHPEFVFGVPNSWFDSIFQAAVRRAGIQDLHFHDSRHEAISRLARYYRALDLATIVGHKYIQELMIYYRPTISSLVAIMQKGEGIDGHGSESAASN